jgi:hypothetical protein
MSDFRPILVPVDDFGVDIGALTLLVNTAAQLGRPLRIVLLENPRLYDAATLPFTREITLVGEEERDLEARLLRRRGSAARNRARSQLLELATRQQVALAFENRAAERLSCVFGPGTDADSWLSRRPAFAARHIAPTALGIVLAGVPGDEAAVAVAHRLAERGAYRDLYVHSNQPWPRAALSELRSPSLRMHPLPATALDAPALLRLLRRLHNELLIMPRELLLGLKPLEVEQALDRAEGQLLLVDAVTTPRRGSN